MDEINDNYVFTFNPSSDLIMTNSDNYISMSNYVDFELQFKKLFELQFKKTHPDAQLPSKAHDDDSGYDVYAVEETIIPKKDRAVVPVGLEFAHIPKDFWVRVEARSGLSFKAGIIPHNGIIDNSYRGDCGVLLYNHSNEDYTVKKGDRIAQLVVYPLYNLGVSFTETKTESERGDKGFGSSGR